ncbi:MAG: type II toxin-antitoxin system HicA family toxin [Sterolibacterium sp.]|jgi:predicted RNA binding protein YcfA (HicA-like mRNA interferase family)|nr:type II toxin-antitoxin system HicA family toxin [Sterolibacterium sp.]
MSRDEKLMARILSGLADSHISFDELCNLLRRMKFDERIRGSHHIFRREDVMEQINLQSDGSQSKAYQVRQVRQIIVKYRLSGEK